jgi:glyoxylase-like metal-dependent hydrolase (beta-lactamase superfamily II)
MNTTSAFIWIPSLKTALGGVAIHSGLHVWMADSQTQEARAQWVATLNQLLTLQPKRVVPGHFLGGEPDGADAVHFTRDYILRFEAELATAHTSADLIKAMTQAYPQLPADDGLTISAKVATGEMSW